MGGGLGFAWKNGNSITLNKTEIKFLEALSYLDL